MLADPLMRLHYIFTSVAEPRIGRGCVARMGIDNGQNTQLSARRQLVVDKVHCPDLVRMRGIGSILPELGLHMPFGRLVAQLQAQLFVKSACPLHVDRPSLTQQKDVDAPLAVTHPRLADLPDPLWTCPDLVERLSLCDCHFGLE